jgi:hypothetical protein
MNQVFIMNLIKKIKVYDEIVIFQESQIIPLYSVHYEDKRKTKEMNKIKSSNKIFKEEKKEDEEEYTFDMTKGKNETTEYEIVFNKEMFKDDEGKITKYGEKGWKDSNISINQKFKNVSFFEIVLEGINNDDKSGMIKFL